MSERRVSATSAEAAGACAAHILRILAGRDRARLVVSGGTTPGLMFDAMACTPFDWSRVHLFFADERMVPPDHPDSNYRLARERFIEPAGFPAANVHRIRGELDPHEAARLYESELDGPFDVVQLGMGGDAHTASLFPGDTRIHSRSNRTAAVYVPARSQWRVSLLPAALLDAAHTVFLATGAEKRDALREVREGAYDPLVRPAQRIDREGVNVVWFTDRAIAPDAAGSR
ncbi:MAG: 6-phosphogluconolactonase [Bryobacterales bacterium]|nr:6-phosphogluconolactonase [Bryobacterales bacterium]